MPDLRVNEPVDGMIVRLGAQRYVLPLASVVETVRPERDQIRPLSDAAGMIELRGRYLPVCRIADLLGIDTGAMRPAEESVIIIVETNHAGLFGLMADTIENRCDVLLRPLEENLHPVRGLAGVTVLDGDAIALILDIEAMVADARARHPDTGMAA
ncbi:chemotaxis protein CheW [Sphingomonas quercus]|uniref:chemotaxis protein CheW n=1 Tax=Sphingomonas quercus TaxID=2842451 RepID=UPI00344826A3